VERFNARVAVNDQAAIASTAWGNKIVDASTGMPSTLARTPEELVQQDRLVFELTGLALKDDGLLLRQSSLLREPLEQLLHSLTRCGVQVLQIERFRHGHDRRSSHRSCPLEHSRIAPQGARLQDSQHRNHCAWPQPLPGQADEQSLQLLGAQCCPRAVRLITPGKAPPVEPPGRQP
jgi:hypothetical protein